MRWGTAAAEAACATPTAEDTEDEAADSKDGADSGDGPGDQEAAAEVAFERACFCFPPPVSNAAALADRRAGVHDCAGQAIPR